MKPAIYLFFIILIICAPFSTAQINIPPSQIVCASCGARVQIGEPHKPDCPYYVKPQTALPSNTNNWQQQIVQGVFSNLFNNMFNYMLNSNNNQTQAQKINQENDDLERQHRLYLQNKYNDSVALARHNKMMSEYKVFDTGTKELQYKGLINQNSGWDASVVVLNEQNWLDNNTQTWVEYQKEQFKIRTEQPNYWCEKYYHNLAKQDSVLKSGLDGQMNYNPLNDSYIPPKRLSEVQAGDVVLIGDGMLVDKFANDNKSGADHTLTCVKVIKGKNGMPDKRLYLDNQPGEGPKIITEEQMIARYGKRELNVAGLREEPWGIAQPLNENEAKKLWDKALELHTKNRENVKFEYGTKNKSDVGKNITGTNYGPMNILNQDNMVYSETSWILVNAGAEGRFQIPQSNSMLLTVSGVKFSPTSFYSSKQFFIITPLAVDK